MLYLLSFFLNSNFFGILVCLLAVGVINIDLKISSSIIFFNEFTYVFYICLFTIVISFIVKWQYILFTNTEVELNFIMLHGTGIFPPSKVMPINVLTLTVKFYWRSVLYFLGVIIKKDFTNFLYLFCFSKIRKVR